MTDKLEILKSPAGTKIIPLESTTFMLGRSGNDSENLVDLSPFDPDEKISRAHLKVRIADGAVFLCDNQSTNGTYFLDGSKLSAGEEVEVESGRQFVLGEIVIRIVLG